MILGVHYRPPAVARRNGILLDDEAIRARAQRVIREFDVRPPDPDLPARALSGGNQQKLIIGREFELAPKLLLIAQPTRGVDIGAIEFIHRRLIALRDAGCAVLLVSAELEEVTALADRLMEHFATPASVGVRETFVVLGGIYFVAMMLGAFGYRIPAPGWKPEGWDPGPEQSHPMVTSGQVHLDRAQVARLCDRHRGIGADGLFRLVPCASGKADWAWQFFNSDGGTAEECTGRPHGRTS